MGRVGGKCECVRRLPCPLGPALPAGDTLSWSGCSPVVMAGVGDKSRLQKVQLLQLFPQLPRESIPSG